MSGNPIDVTDPLDALDDFFMEEVLGSDDFEGDAEASLALALADLQMAELLFPQDVGQGDPIAVQCQIVDDTRSASRSGLHALASQGGSLRL